MRNHGEKGMALATSILVLLLISTMIVGMSWMVMTDQKLGGNNQDRQLAFYGAEAGLEALTASLENLFNTTVAPNNAAINALMLTPPTNIGNIQFLAAGSVTPNSGYIINFTPNPAIPGVPLSSFGTVPTGPYEGLVALMTPYTLQVTARTPGGSEVKLQRAVQTVAIPIFQFGIFSQTDLAFFAGPNFNFGGRVHTNGNLWLAEGNGSTLTLAQKVTAAGEIITANLENGWQTAVNYTGTVNITTGSAFQNLDAQLPPQSVLGNNNVFGAIGAINEPAFAAVASGVYNGNVGVRETGVKTLNLAIATPSLGGQPIDLIRLPQPGEDVANLGKFTTRDYSQASFRILLADYGPNGACATSDLNNLPRLAPPGANPATPLDLATLAWDQSAAPANANNGANPPPFNGPPGWLANVGTQTFPLPVSRAGAAAAYTAADGYWVQKWMPIETGCIKIEYQAVGGGWVDVTAAILNRGFTGRNVNPQTAATMGNVANQSPKRVALPGAQINGQGPTANGAVATVGCADPSAGAIIRLARERDNPTFSNGVGGCPPPPAAGANSNHGTDYWPNVLYDTRESILRDAALAGNAMTPAGAMHYVELDVNNLAAWMVANAGVITPANAFSVYFSDRRGNLADPNSPPSVGPGPLKTGGYGFDDFVNPNNANGCPDALVNQGEDVEGDYSTMGVDQNPTAAPRTYGNTLNPLPALLWPIRNGGPVGTQLGAVNALVNSVLANNPSCGGPGNKWPFAAAVNGADLRQNPPMFFRRALKIVNGSTINLGVCNGVPCGLTIVSENPVYIQGDYNNPGLLNNFGNPGVAAAVIADTVTLLSDRWNDTNTFAFPYNTGSRNAATTTYRLAVAAGKGIPFPQPAVGAPPQDFGTDGGTHNFLRYLENWGGQTLWYRGSIVSMFYNHQGVGVYKCCNTVYSPPTRGYNFDTNFLTPALLPPLTPMLRDINTIGFTQMFLPTQ